MSTKSHFYIRENRKDGSKHFVACIAIQKHVHDGVNCLLASAMIRTKDSNLTRRAAAKAALQMLDSAVHAHVVSIDESKKIESFIASLGMTRYLKQRGGYNRAASLGSLNGALLALEDRPNVSKVEKSSQEVAA